MSSPNKSARARVSTSAAMAATTVAKFQNRKWTTDDIIQFLGLLKRYPVLYQKISSTYDVKSRRDDALQALFSEQASHHLGIPDIPSMKNKIANFQKTFSICLNSYKKDMNSKGPSTAPIVKWFSKAGFLDQTGFLRKIAATTAKPGISRPTPPIPRISMNLRPRRTARSMTAAPPTPKPTPRPEQNGVQIKEEFDYNHMDDGDDDDETEEGEYVPAETSNYHNHTHQQQPQQHHQEQSIPRPTVRHSMPAVHVAPHAQQEHASYHQQPESNIVIDSVFHHADFNSTMPAPAKEPDYLSSFLDYTKIRTQGYTGRQKRQIINVLSTLMNNADEENESPGQEYGYPIYDYSAADSLK